MKKFVLLLIILACAICIFSSCTPNNTSDPTPSNKPTLQDDGIIYQLSEDGSFALVKGYKGSATEFGIADEYQGVPVTVIDSSAFASSDIKKVIIPNSVRVINSEAFYNCKSLEYVGFSNGLASIEAKAFDGCTSLKKIDLPDSLISIGDYAFQNCESFRCVIIPEGVKSIGRYAFFACDNLKCIILSDSVESIGSSAFSQCENLSYVNYEGSESDWNAIENDATIIIGKTALCFNYGISDTTPGVIYEIADTGTYATVVNYFGNDIDVVIADTYSGLPVTSIGSLAFAENESLRSISLPESIESIGVFAFKNCPCLISVNMTEGLKTIASGAFTDCVSLSEIVIPQGVTAIESGTFFGCVSLRRIVIADSVRTIGSFAFAYCYSLSSIVIPEGVTEIGEEAFRYCESLESVFLPKSITTIQNQAFYNCQVLYNVYYAGSEEDWNQVSNIKLTVHFLYAAIHYNYNIDE